MYNDLHSYTVHCIWTNSTSSGICNQRRIYGIINKIIIIIIIIIITASTVCGYFPRIQTLNKLQVTKDCSEIQQHKMKNWCPYLQWLKASNWRPEWKKPIFSSSLHHNDIGMAPYQYDTVYHVCQQISAHVT